MVARAQATAATAQRILDAAEELFDQLPYDHVALSAVATQAGVTVQTVIRRFNSKDGLFTAVAQRRRSRIRSGRERAPVADPEGAVRNTVDHYELWGDAILHQLAQESRVPEVLRGTEIGRRYHHGWVRRVFEPLLTKVPIDERELRLTQLVVATDLYTWKILRRDFGLDRSAVEHCMIDMARAILAPT
jgi:AcrR family transcriptional regulator